MGATRAQSWILNVYRTSRARSSTPLGVVDPSLPAIVLVVSIERVLVDRDDALQYVPCPVFVAGSIGGGIRTFLTFRVRVGRRLPRGEKIHRILHGSGVRG